MNLNELTKEQKQVLFLGAMLTIGALYAVYRFVLVPTLGTFGVAGTELVELEDKLKKADLAMAQQEQYRRDLARTADEMKKFAKLYIPPLENALSWATEIIYRSARSVGVEVESVAVAQVAAVPWDQKGADKGGKGKGKEQEKDKQAARVFVPFSVRLVAKCGYFDLIRFVEAVEQSNPYVCVSAISVGASMTDPTMHDVSLSIEWPAWKEGAGPEMIREPKILTPPPGSPGAGA